MLRRVRPALLVTALALPCLANAFTVAISPGPRAIYLRVGTGGYTGRPYSQNTNTLRDDSTVNLVSLDVPASQVGSGSDLAMTVDGGSAQLVSHWDNFTFCNAGQVYIGGFYRFPDASGGPGATLTVSMAPLSNGAGDVIAPGQISWTTSGNGDGTNPQPIPAGAFTGGSQTLAAFPRNSWRESCMTFRYGNDTVVGAGTYRATATYTLTAP
ncbi:MAG: hypothetical protein ACOY9B_04405 [Pseudomonadota bacterium]